MSLHYEHANINIYLYTTYNHDFFEIENRCHELCLNQLHVAPHHGAADARRGPLQLSVATPSKTRTKSVATPVVDAIKLAIVLLAANLVLSAGTCKIESHNTIAWRQQ